MLGGFFAEGLAAREQLHYFGSGTEDSVLAALEQRGLDPQGLQEAGVLAIAHVEAAYFPDGRFDARANLEGFRALARRAVADGFSGIRVAAENAAVLNHPAIRDSWFDYELQVDAVVAAEPIVGLCAFDRRVCDRESLALLDALHLLQHDPTESAPRNPFHLQALDADVLMLTGDVDAFAAPGFTRLLAESARRRERLRLDVRGLRFLDAAGLRAIEELARQRPPELDPLQVLGRTPFQLRVWELSDRPEGGGTRRR